MHISDNVNKFHIKRKEGERIFIHVESVESIVKEAADNTWQNQKRITTADRNCIKKITHFGSED